VEDDYGRSGAETHFPWGSTYPSCRAVNKVKVKSYSKYADICLKRRVELELSAPL